MYLQKHTIYQRLVVIKIKMGLTSTLVSLQLILFWSYYIMNVKYISLYYNSLTLYSSNHLIILILISYGKIFFLLQEIDRNFVRSAESILNLIYEYIFNSAIFLFLQVLLCVIMKREGVNRLLAEKILMDY